MADTPLGQEVKYPDQYDQDLLVAIARETNRTQLGLEQTCLPFTGVDIWKHYEVSWLDEKGKPEVGIARIIVPCESPNLIESKSMKLYFNSLNQKKFSSEQDFLATVSRDLSQCADSEITIELDDLLPGYDVVQAPIGKCLDTLDIETEVYDVDASFLYTESQDDTESTAITEEALHTNLFKSSCPVTGQPDWATITVSYRGPKINQEGLLKYLVSYRLHSDFHENCAERIFTDIHKACKPEQLTIEANFLRRGGLEINPVRTTDVDHQVQDIPRLMRQ